MAYSRETVIEFIATGKIKASKATIVFDGFEERGDAGNNLRFYKNGASGAASRTPSQRGDNTFTDSAGAAYKLIEGSVVSYDGTNNWFGGSFGDSGVGIYVLNSTGWGVYTDVVGLVGEAETARDESVAAKDKVLNRVASYEVESTEYLISTFDGSDLSVGDVVKTLGYSSIGDGGKGDWIKLSDGSAVSQSPSSLSTTQLSDSAGVLYDLAPEKGVVSIKSVGGIGSADISLSILAAANGASSGRHILDLGNDNVNVTGTITFPNTLPITQGSRGAIIGDGTGDIIIDNVSSNGKKKVFGTITGMDRALVVRGSINHIEFHTLSGSRQCLVMESLTSASADRSLDNVIKGVQIGACTDAIVFQQHEDETVQQGNEVRVNFLSGVVNGIVFDDDGQHTSQGDWDSNFVELQAIDNTFEDASFLLNRSNFLVNNQTVWSHSWNGGLVGSNSKLIKGAFRGCDLKFITASPTTADDVCSETDADLISTCSLIIKRGGSKLSTTAGEMIEASSTQDLASFNGGAQLQNGMVLIDYTTTVEIAIGAMGRCFIFHALAYSTQRNVFEITPFNTPTLSSIDQFIAPTISSNGDRGMINIWFYNKTGSVIPAGSNFKWVVRTN